MRHLHANPNHLRRDKDEPFNSTSNRMRLLCYTSLKNPATIWCERRDVRSTSTITEMCLCEAFMSNKTPAVSNLQLAVVFN